MKLGIKIMNGKFIVTILLIASLIICCIEEKPQENRVNADTGKLKEIQTEINSILMKDRLVQKLLNGNNSKSLKILEVIHNDSADVFYRILKYKNVEGINGEIYRIAVDLKNKTVRSTDEVENIEIISKGSEKSNTVHSLVFVEFSPGVWLNFTRYWVYEFNIESFGRGNGCIEYRMFVEKSYNKENFFFNVLENDPESRMAWSDAGEPHIECKYADNITCEVVYGQKSIWDFITPSDLPSNVSFFHRWQVRVKQKQMIAFDLVVELYCKSGKETHRMRIFLSTPPDPHELSSFEKERYRIEVVKIYGTTNYYAYGPVTAVLGEQN
ncbi:hypothetical protein DRP05_00675 [Archaeoglobales archaeon]|nr:MAG: hypothetical protein DRP05_00675 [Archaeoglobales archaeon]